MFSGLSLIKILAWFLVYFIVGKIFFARKYFKWNCSTQKNYKWKKNIEMKKISYMNLHELLTSINFIFTSIFGTLSPQNC